jgi:hypothetical protein
MASYAKTTVSVTSAAWTAVSPPFPCNGFTCKNADNNNILICTNPTDPNSVDTLLPGVQEVCPAALPWGVYAFQFALNGAWRFIVGNPVFYLKGTQDGTSQLAKITWIA